MLDTEGTLEPDRFKYELSLQYPILGINILHFKKINNILSLHPDLSPENSLKTALSAGGLAGIITGTGTSLLIILLNNMLKIMNH